MKRKLIYSMFLVFAGGIAMAQNNTYTGTNAGNGTSGGSQIVAYGYNAGDVVTGTANSFLGGYAGYKTTSGSYNTFLGHSAGYWNVTAINNTFVGNSAGYNTTGDNNTFIGMHAGLDNTTAEENVFLGLSAGRNNTTGWYNTYLGSDAGYSGTTATQNVYIGYRSGYSSTGTLNVFLGHQSGYSETGSNKLYIDNSSTSSPLIWGDFTNNYVNINGSLAVGTTSPSDNFHVVGTARFQSLTRLDTLSRVMVTNTSGKVYWRKASTLLGAGDNLGNHTATQDIVPNVTGSYDVGVFNYGFRNLYLTNAVYMDNGRVFYTDVSNTLLFLGSGTGQNNTTGNYNTIIGQNAGLANTTGSHNHFVGATAGQNNTTGNSNHFSGDQAGSANISGSANYFSGLKAGFASTGDGNHMSGYFAGYNTTTGIYNTFVGNTTAAANTTGSFNVSLGYGAGTGSAALDNTVAIGANTVTTASNQVRIGDGNITSIGGQVSWTTISDGRFKKGVKQDVAGLDFILQLKPVSYIIDKNAVDDFLGIPQERRAKQRGPTERQTGFIAQEVEALVKKSNYAFYGVDAPKGDKDHYGIRYSEFVMPLVKAVQELNTKVDGQQALIEEQKQLIDKQQQMMTALMDRFATVTAEPAAKGAVLYQNHPNPFRNGETEITMDIPESVQSASVTVYDMNGRTIDKVTVSTRGKGVTVKAGAGKMSAGIYLYSLVVDGRIAGVNKMVAE